jgi:hypothetical protein
MNLNFLAGSAEEEISSNRWRQIVQLQQKAIEESRESVNNNSNNAVSDPLRSYHSDNTRGHQPSKSNDIHKRSTISNNDKNKDGNNNEVSKPTVDADPDVEGRARAYSLSDRLATPSTSRGSLVPVAVAPTVSSPHKEEFAVPKKKERKGRSHLDQFLDSINQGMFQPEYFEQMVRYFLLWS